MGNFYQHPPIVEAVVDFRMVKPLDQKTISKLEAAFAASYPQLDKVQTIQVDFNPKTGAVRKSAQVFGFKRLNNEATEVILTNDTGFTVAQLAPYTDWETFVGRVRRDWSIWKKKADFRTLSRIGVRFINRLDIPLHENTSMRPEDYITVGPNVPKAVNEIGAFQSTISFGVEHLEANVTLRAGTAESPLLNHASIMLDIDIAKSEQVPLKEEDIFMYLDKVRLEKNKLFESCITDKMRSLFS